MPGDRSETPESEGAAEGESIEIRVGGAPAASALWHTGTYVPLPLGAAPGADLAVTLDDAVLAVSAGGILEFAVEVANLGPAMAAGVRLEVALPAPAELVSASDGGLLADGVLVWPDAELAEGDSLTRTFSVRIASAVPAGLADLATVARVAHNGSAGADPQPGNDRASDLDRLDAEPDLMVAASDGIDETRPGATLVGRVVLANHGSQGATGALAAVELPPGVEFFSASHGGHLEAGRVRWPPIGLDAGAESARTFTVRVPPDLAAAVTSLLFRATAGDDGANGPDADLADNTAEDRDTVFHAPDLEAVAVRPDSVATDPATLEIGGLVEVDLGNRGTLPVGSFGLVVFLDLDADGSYAAASDGTLGVTSHPGLATGAVGSIAVPVAGTLRFRGESLSAAVDPEGARTELDESNNVASSAAGCRLPPATSPFAPVVELAWPPPAGEALVAPGSIDSLSTPIVVQLTDDNGDGRWDERDVPDIAFVTTNFYELMEPQIYLRAIRGDSGAAIFDVDGFLPHPTAPAAFSFSGLAAGDIDNDGKPELVTTTFGPAPANALVALEHNGVRKWQSEPYHTHPSSTGLTNRDNPTIADLNGDGFAEIVVGAHVFDRFGHLLWRGAGGQAFQSSGNSGDRGGAIAAVADVDLDGRLEVVTGNTLYRHDGEIVWQVPLDDGFPAPANFDADPQPEIVVVSRGTVRLHDADGALLWGPVELPGSDPEAGGAPTVADFDGDGAPEVGVAGSDVYVVLETDGSIRWQAATQDHTSNLTGSTVFDFDGDGAFEVVYRDERRLRIYRGSDGVVLFEDVLSSNTWTEEPVVADVDRDGNAEIVVTSDRAPDVPIPGGQRTAGVRVYGDARDGWTWARAIWNQHAYTPELVGDDGGIPAHPAWGWSDHNTFRANLPPHGDPSAAPNLTASRIQIDLTALPLLRATVRIANAGRTPVAPGLPVAFYDGDSLAGGALLDVETVPRWLGPGEYVDVAAEIALDLPASGELVAVADDDGTGAGRERECDESDNGASAAYEPSALGLWIEVDDGTSALAAGEETSYTIQVSSAFPGTATGVAIRALLPPHLLFVAASDGGTVVAAAVSWPVVSLGSGETLVRTLTARLDPALPAGIAAVTTQVEVTDDGAQGADPSPWNNTAVDVDAVISVTADAGGPYLALEGELVALDGSSSFDRDGTIVAFDWDLDGDGAFDDAAGPVASFVAPDEGSFPVRLRVRDDAGEVDVDSATVEVSDAAPAILGLGPLAREEGASLSLSGIQVTDPGALDALSAFIDWGDGASEAAAVVGGTIVTSHVYVDDGAYPLRVCASDGDGGETCGETAVEISNSAPEVEDWLDLDFRGWQVRELAMPGSTEWDPSADERTVTERRNGEPALYVGDFPAFGRYELTVRVADGWDDDYVGLALGVDPAALGTPASDFLLVDWKRADQGGARRGLALSRVHGAPTESEFWGHLDQAANGTVHRVEELARGSVHGTSGWARHTEYRLRVDYAPGHLRLWVDDALELDVAGNFPAGRLALYDYSQANVIFAAVGSGLGVWGTEGSPAALRARFHDAGSADTHVARMEWGDGTVEAVPLAQEPGQGEVAAEHRYLDDGELPARLCVTDDDGGEGCSSLAARIGNVAPSLELALAATGYREDPVTLAGSTFTDPGLLDVHSATVDWGDGTVEAAAVTEAAGSGSLSAVHTYAAAGGYRVSVCVDDGDGGSTCDEREVQLVDRCLDLAVVKSAPVAEARPGQRIVYTLVARNLGTVPATGVMLRDLLPEHLRFVSASGGGVHTGGVVTWSLGTMAAGASLSRTLAVDVAAEVPFGAVAINVAEVGDDGGAGPDGAPENNRSEAELRLSDAATPIVTLATWAPIVESGSLTLAGSRWSDTTSGEPHTAIVDWGDGSSGSAALSPAAGTGGNIAASHVYVDDGRYPVAVCVTDAASHSGCAARDVVVTNSAPVVVEPGAVRLTAWTEEEFETRDPSANWAVAPDGLSVLQTVNSQPSIFFSPFQAYGVFLEGSIQVGSRGDWDDDFIGFVLGYEAGDHLDPEADWLLVDWKQQNQSNRRGLALSRVRGVPNGGELWAHTGHVTELARAATLGDTGWRDRQEYRFRFEYSAERFRLWVDDVLQFDLEGDFPEGNFGFYNYSQQDVRYRGFSSGLEQRFEGETFEVRIPFADLGRLDTHEATVDWDDGALEPASAPAQQGVGYVTDRHAYLDDGDFLIEVCVEDDGGAVGCGRYGLLVLNRPPEVGAEAGGVAVAGVGSELPLARFTDPGRLDSHTATIDWGDGASGSGSVIEDAGEGSVAGTHAWSAVGTYEVRVCVADDDGGSACDQLAVEVLATPPQISAAKTVEAVDRDGDGQVSPGDDLVYRIEIANTGGSPVTGVTFTDPIPAHTRVIPGSLVPSLLAVSEDPVTVAVPELAAGAAIVVQFAVTIDSPLPAGVREIVNSGAVTSAEAPPVPTDDPTRPGASDPTRIGVEARPALTLAKSAQLVDLDGDGFATPGDEIEWRLELVVGGATAASGLLVTDPWPATAPPIAGSAVPSLGSVVGLDPLLWSLDRLGAGEAAALTFRSALPSDLAAEVEWIVNQAHVASSEVDALASDDPATAEPADPTRLEVFVPPLLEVESVAASEGDAGTTPVTFRLRLDRPARRPLAVDWSTAAGTAQPGEDFEPAQGTVAFAPGESERAVVVQAIGDLVVENAETLRLVLTNPRALRLAATEAAGTLLDDDETLLAVADSAVTEGETVRFAVTLSAPSALPVAVDFATAAGSATGGADYVERSGTLLFAPLQVGIEVEVATLQDAEREEDESFALRLSNPSVATLGDAEGTARISDDDRLPRVAVVDAEVVEGDEGEVELRFRLSLSDAADEPVVVSYATAEETAQAGVDFVSASGEIVLPSGAIEGWVPVLVHGDRRLESDETLGLELGSATGALIEDGVARGTIRDDELCPGPNLLVNGGGESRPVGGGLPGWTAVAGADWRALRYGDDPEPFEGIGLFAAASSAASELAQEVDLSAYARSIDRGEQRFRWEGAYRTGGESPDDVARFIVEYIDPSGETLEAFDSGPLAAPEEWVSAADERPAPVGTRRARVSLLAEQRTGPMTDVFFDALSLRALRTPTLSVGDLSEYERDSGLHDAQVPVRLSCPLDSPVTAYFATAPGSATEGVDYLAAVGTLELASGEAVGYVPVPIVGDTVDEPAETLFLDAGPIDPDDVVGLDPRGTLTLLDDDFCRRSPGYWKTHREQWPVDWLLLGAVEYDDTALMDFLRYGGSDGSTRLARHLTATKLNLARGSDPWILPTAEAADAFLALLPPGSRPGGDDLSRANALKDELDAYNNSGCDEP